MQKNVEEVVFVNMVGKKLIAKIVEEALFANMVGKKLIAVYVHTASTKKEK